MDNIIFKHFSHHKNTLLESHCVVPKIWFGLSSCSSITNDITGDNKYYLIQKLQDTLNALYPHFNTVCEKIIPEKDRHLPKTFCPIITEGQILLPSSKVNSKWTP
jgi:hypothetical protein